MTFTLILVGVYSAMQVGTFATMDECKRAATASPNRHSAKNCACAAWLYLRAI